MKSEIYLEHANFTVSNLFESVTTHEQNKKCGLENILEILKVEGYIKDYFIEKTENKKTENRR